MSPRQGGHVLMILPRMSLGMQSPNLLFLLNLSTVIFYARKAD